MRFPTMCDQQSLRSACAYAHDLRLCLSLEYPMSLKLLTEHHLRAGLGPLVKYFTDRSGAVFFSVLCLLCHCMCLFICALWLPAGKGLTSWLSFEGVLL